MIRTHTVQLWDGNRAGGVSTEKKLAGQNRIGIICQKNIA